MMACRILLTVLYACGVGICAEGSAISTANYASPAALGISFVEGSTSTLLMKRDGREYLVDLAAQTVREAGGHQAETSLPTTSPNPSQGASIFSHNCAGCHGADGKGTASAHTPNFTDSKLQASLTDDQILTTIKKGKPGTIMPAWSDKLSEQDIKSVAAHIRSFGTGGVRHKDPDSHRYPRRNPHSTSLGTMC